MGEYAIVKNKLGNGHIKALCMDGKTRICRIRGSMIKQRARINVDDYILLSLRDYQDEKADVIYKYSADEVRLLKDKKELLFLHINENDADLVTDENSADDLIDFRECDKDSTKSSYSSDEKLD